jgi:hypothetical protein
VVAEVVALVGYTIATKGGLLALAAVETGIERALARSTRKNNGRKLITLFDRYIDLLLIFSAAQKLHVDCSSIGSAKTCPGV